MARARLTARRASRTVGLTVAVLSWGVADGGGLLGFWAGAAQGAAPTGGSGLFLMDVRKSEGML